MEMDVQDNRPLALLATALCLGVFAQVLFHPALVGINLLLYTAALVAAVTILARVHGTRLRGEGRWLLAPLLLFSLLAAWRASPILQVLNGAAVVATLGVATFRVRDGVVRAGPVSTYAWLGIRTAFSAATGAIAVLREAPWTALPGRRFTARIPALARGLALGVPLLIAFGALFAAADDVFAHFLATSVDADLGRALRHIAGVLAWSWISGGILYGMLIQTPGEAPEVRPASWLRIGPIEVVTVLGLLDLLFLGFVVVQVRYLFGGAGHVEASVDLTYAEYARRGFFELVAVAALVLPVVLGLNWLLPRESRTARRTFGLLGAGLVLLLFVVMASAGERLRAYTGEFGLTQVRLYAAALMVWLAIVFGWLIVTVLRDRPNRFVFGALAAGFATVAGLNVLNPDAFIVRTNLARMGERPFDAAYALSLSPDATPTLVAKLPSLEPSTRCEVARTLAQRRDGDTPWQAWNLARHREADVLESNAAALAAACP